ncbi:MAG: OsmC family protein [Chitinophagaceae bacterium]
MKTITYWKAGFAFDSQFKQNSIALDDANASGRDDSGFSPKALLLSGLAGCTGIDIISILDKMKAPYQSIRIETEAAQTEEHPRVFKDISITYYIKIPADYEDKVKRAVDLSLEKYCGVAAMLRKHCAIHAKVIIEQAN